MYGFVQFLIRIQVSCIDTVITDHLKVFFRDMSDQTADKVHDGDCLLNVFIVLMPVVIKGDILSVIVQDALCRDHRTAKISADMRSGKRECWTCSAKKTDRDCCRNRILTETELIEAGKWAVGTNQNFEMEYYCKVERADIYRDRIIFTFREGDKRIWQRK